LLLGDDAYCIVPSENYMDVARNYSSIFKTIQCSDTIEQTRDENFVAKYMSTGCVSIGPNKLKPSIVRAI